MTMVQAICDALGVAMERSSDVVLIGEDIGKHGGVFRATDGLQARFGTSRVMDAPLSETGIIGTAVGMAVQGLKPVAEIQFSDYMFPAFDQIVSEVATFRYRSGGEFTCPLVIRTPYGGGIKGGMWHSQSPEGYYTHTPGLTVVIPSTPSEAKGLLLAALEGEDPVLFFEPKRLYRSITEPVATGYYTEPVGPSAVVKEGTFASVFCYGAMVPVVRQAVEKIEALHSGVTFEIVNLRTLYPVDEQGILTSVTKTGRAVIVHEAPKTCGYGAEISALLAEKALASLEAPVLRVTGWDTPYPYSTEAWYAPQAHRVFHALETLVKDSW
ncbi:MAG: alpha-ketoacid dehydrogenase subunit beta [Vampirovibrionales bacterium]